MERLHCKLPVHQRCLDAFSMDLVFESLDANKNGLIDGDEVDAMFSVLTEGPVKLSGRKTAYSLERFIELAERVALAHPFMRVMTNLEARFAALSASANTVDDLFPVEKCNVLYTYLAATVSSSGALGMRWALVQLGLPRPHIQYLTRLPQLRQYDRIGSSVALRRCLLNIHELAPFIDILCIASKMLRGRLLAGPLVPPPLVRREEPGQKRALLVGINYAKTRVELAGCVNDVLSHKELLLNRFGFDDEEILLLTEAQVSGVQRPTCDAILAGIQWLLSGATKGDLFFFHYSGHGSQVVAHTECDGINECICPIDAPSDFSKIITDETLNEVLFAALPSGVKLVCIFDCCHARTDQAPPAGAEADPTGRRTKSRYIVPSSETLRALETLAATGARRDVRHPSALFPDKQIWLLSACRDDEASVDAFFGGRSQGALSWSLFECLQDFGDYHPSYEDLVKCMRARLKAAGILQVPMLSTTHPTNLCRPYLE